MPGLIEDLTQKIRSIDGDGLAYVTRGYLIQVRDEMERLALTPSTMDENNVNIEDLDAYISDLYSNGEGRLGERELEKLVQYVLKEARVFGEGFSLEMTAKQTILLHMLYCIGADAMFLQIDANAIADAASFTARHLKEEELHDLRDKMTRIARLIPGETYAALGVKKVEL